VSTSTDTNGVRVLYSFPHRLGTGRICTTAWYQIVGTANAGVDYVVKSASVEKELPGVEPVDETLARGRLKLPFRVIGDQRMYALHDGIVARWLRRHHREVDLVHVWPSGALETLKVAHEYSVPTVLERPNAHTRFAYEVVRAESERIGVELPPDHEHSFNAEALAKEEREYALADKLLCPSEFTAQTFRDAGHPESQIVRHFYGVDPAIFHPADRDQDRPFTAIFVGVAAVRKGLHFALEAWKNSAASLHGRFLIAGEILPDYARVLVPLLDQSSVHALGHCENVPELLRQADILVLPSIEEGFGLVCTEAMASGCVPLVSNACTEICMQGENAMVHAVGDVDALSAQMSLIFEDGAIRELLRANGIRSLPDITWAKAGERLRDIYAAVA
jgi:glycosyltransferase involved in cell wall biosynthesis